MIKCKFLNYREETNFQRDLNAGNIPEGAIAFIHNPREIWARGMYYPCGSLSDTEIAAIENRISQSLGDDINTLNDALSLKADKSDIPTDYVTQSDISGKVDRSSLSNVAFTGEWDDIINKPVIPQSTDFNLVLADWNETSTSSKSYIKNKPNLHMVATTGSYTDLSNKPTIPTKTSLLTNDSQYITLHQQLKTINNQSIVGSGNITISGGASSWNDLTDKPTIPNEQIQSDWGQTNQNAKDYIKNKPTSLSNFTNDPGFITVNNVPLADWNETDVDSDSYIKNKPVIPAGVIVDTALSNTSTNAVQNKAIKSAIDAIGDRIDSLSAVATSGKYTDLINTPQIPDDISQLTNIQFLKTLNENNIGGGTTGATALPQLGDVEITNPRSGQALVYVEQNSAGKWINGDPTDPFLITLANIISGGEVPTSWNNISINNSLFDVDGNGNVTIEDLQTAAQLRGLELGFVADYVKNFYGKSFLTSSDLGEYATRSYVDEKVSAPESMDGKLLGLYNFIADNFVLKADVPYTGDESEAPTYSPSEEPTEPGEFISYTHIRPISLSEYLSANIKNNVCYIVYEE